MIRRFLLSISLVLACTGLAQTETDARATVFGYLSMVQTTYRITLDGRDLEVLSQGITLRAVYHPSDPIVRTPSGTIGSGSAGYRAYHFEFMYTDQTIDFSEQTIVEFWRDQEVLFRISIKDPSRRMVVGGDQRRDIRALAINLEDIPLVILDAIDRIEIREPDLRETGNPDYLR